MDLRPQAIQPDEPGSFPILGIGASGGGREAFSELLRHLPRKTGMPFCAPFGMGILGMKERLSQ